MRIPIGRLTLTGGSIATVLLLAFGMSPTVRAADDIHSIARPFAFVGTVGNCGVAGSRIVTAAWLRGMGLPDRGAGGLNTTAADVTSNPNKRDPHYGLLLSKNGATSDCSAAGATINGFDGDKDDSVAELGFDFRNGTHCGAGAPRFNITSNLGFTYFAGCGAGAQTPAPQDPTEWTRVRLTTTAQVFAANPTAPPFVFGPGGTLIRRLSIVFDEGTDTASASDPMGVGLVVLDNIDVDGQIIKSGTGIVY